MAIVGDAYVVVRAQDFWINFLIFFRQTFGLHNKNLTVFLRENRGFSGP